MANKINIDKDKLINYMKNHTNKEAAEYFSVSVRTIARRLKEYNLSYEELKFKDFSLNLLQKEILIGSLLGDGCIECNRFRFCQEYSRKEYVKWIFDNLKPLSKKIYKEKNYFSGKLFFSKRMYTSRHSVIKKLKEKWYKDIKIVPRDLKLTPNIFLHWILQDGCNNQKKKSFRIHTNCFRENDILFLMERLKEDLNIKSSLNFQKKYPIIHIGSYEYNKVIDVLKPLVIWKCFKYKIDTSQVPIKKNSNLGSYKLDYKMAKEIKRLYNKNFSMTKIANLFDVTVTSISNVINEKTYKSKDTAKINVSYRPK